MTDSELDKIYRTMNDMCYAKDTEGIIGMINNCSDDIDECIAVLFWSQYFQSEYKELRDGLMTRTIQLLTDNGEDPKSALIGLL